MRLASSWLLLSSTCLARLLVDPARESQLTPEQLIREAELVGSSTEEAGCREVLVEVRLYSYFLIEGTGLREKNVKVAMNMDSVIEHKNSGSWIPNIQRIVPRLNCLDQTNPELVAFLRDEFLWPPFTGLYDTQKIREARSKDDKWTNSFSQGGQDMFLDRVLFKTKITDGFFIEAGADDLVTDSNTLFFEMERGWTGILIEPTLWDRHDKGLVPKRNCWTVPLCLGLRPFPHFAPFSPYSGGGMAGLVSKEGDRTRSFQCFPLMAILLAAGNRTVNYLSLDIEGAELKVLETLPWGSVDVEVVSVEVQHLGSVFPGTRHQLHLYLAAQGYKYIGTVFIDDIFVREDCMDKYRVEEEALEDFSKLYKFDPPQSDSPKEAERIKEL